MGLLPDDPLITIDEVVTREMVGEAVGRVTNRELLMIIAPEEKVSFSATARKGTGVQHAKWSPIGGDCYYRPLYRGIRIDEEAEKQLDNEQRESFVKVCPKRVFDIEDGHLAVRNADDCDACTGCIEWAADYEMQGLVTVPEPRFPEWHRFYVETDGSLPADFVITRALEVVGKRLQRVAGSAGSQLMYPQLGK